MFILGGLCNCEHFRRNWSRTDTVRGSSFAILIGVAGVIIGGWAELDRLGKDWHLSEDKSVPALNSR
eukprot:3343658-Amphidinium_carterae.1